MIWILVGNDNVTSWTNIRISVGITKYIFCVWFVTWYIINFLGFCVPGLLDSQLCVDLFKTTATTTNCNKMNNPIIPTGATNTESGTDPRIHIGPVTSNTCTTITKSTATTTFVFWSRKRLRIISWALVIGCFRSGLLTTAVTFNNTILCWEMRIGMQK